MRGGAACVAYCHGSLEPILPRLHLADFVVLLMLNWNTFYLRGTPGCIPIFSSDSTTAQMLVVKKYGSMIISGGCTWLAFDCPDANTSAPTHEWSAQFPPSGIWIHLNGLPIELPTWENSSHCLPTADAANPSIFQQRMVVFQLGNSCLVFYGLVLILLCGTFVKKIDSSKLHELHERHQAFKRDHSALHQHWQDVEQGIGALMTKQGQRTRQYAKILAFIVPLLLLIAVVMGNQVAGTITEYAGLSWGFIGGILLSCLGLGLAIFLAYRIRLPKLTCQRGSLIIRARLENQKAHRYHKLSIFTPPPPVVFTPWVYR